MTGITVATRAAQRPRPARAVLRTEFRLFLREPGALFWIMVFPVGLLAILGLIPTFREPSADLGGQRVIDFYVPTALLLCGIMASIQAMPTVIATYRDQKVLRRIATTPARPWQVLAAQYALHGAAVVIGSTLVVVVGRLVFDVDLPGSPAAYLLVLALALMASLTLGGLIAGLSPTAKISSAIGTIAFFVMMFTAGLWLPVQTMPPLMRDIVQLTPLGAAARGLGQASLGQWPDAGYLATMALWIVGLGALGARWFRWE